MYDTTHPTLDDHALDEKNVDTSNDIEKSSKSGMVEMLKDPGIIMALYIMVSHPSVQDFLGKYITNFSPSEEGVGIINLIMQGVLMVGIYFIIKFFL